jgi:hypothetical protein
VRRRAKRARELPGIFGVVCYLIARNARKRAHELPGIFGVVYYLVAQSPVL